MEYLGGLNEFELELIRATCKRFAGLERVVLFGSRAKGIERPSSDVDLAVFGKLDELAVEALRHELDELPLPFKFDTQAFEKIDSAPLREHISRVGITLLG